MKKVIGILSAVLISCFGSTVFADSAASPTPMQQASESLDKNIAKNPDSPGLPRAFDRLIENRKRFNDKREEKASRPKPSQGGRVDRVQQIDGPGRVERVDMPARIERAELPERPGLIDRPVLLGRPGLGRPGRIDPPGLVNRKK